MNYRPIAIVLFSLALGGCAGAATALPTMRPETAAPPTPTLVTAVATRSRGCSAARPEPTPAASIFPLIREEDYTVGPAGASVTLIEYCDFQAPICRSMAAVVSNVIYNHREDVRLVFRPVPLIDRLDKSALAVQAAIAAGEQKHFWEMYDLLFQHSDQWDGLTPADFELWLKDKSASLGLDAAKFGTDLASPATVEKMKSMAESARQLDLVSLPLLVINGGSQPMFALDYASIESTISLIALGKRQFKECPPFMIDPTRQYIATLHTEKGDVVLELYPDKAPLAVNSFVFLARSGWFEDITFHRVIEGFMAQTGDPSGSSRGNPGYFFEDELNNGLSFDGPGVVAMANQGAGTNGSQFFITYGAFPAMDGKYTIFGHVLSGMEILEKLTPRDPEADPGAPPGDKLISVKVEEK